MATRSSRFFMRPSEYTELLWRVATELDLAVAFYPRGLNRHLELASRPGTLLMADGRAADTVFLMAQMPALECLRGERLDPAKWGWVESGVPREQGHTLFMVRLAARSDWGYSEDGRARENPASLALFRRVATRFRRQLKRPVWASRIDGKGWEPVRDVGFSDGTVAWAQQGGELRQEGVANVRYAIEAPTDG